MVVRTTVSPSSTELLVNRSPRRILRLGAAFGALLIGASAAAAADYKQAPMLDALVADGTLPPVEERLPANPRVVEPFESIGTYGGTWRSGMVGGSDRNWLFRIGGYEPLVAWDREWSGAVIPNLAESVTPNEDSTVFTVKLRDGLKWSDGEPFTSDDLGFFVEDIAGNAELLPNGISWMMSGGELPAFEKVDDSTFTLTFKEPYGLFPQRLASGYGVQAVMMAKHYCSQFMPTYNEAGLADVYAINPSEVSAAVVSGFVRRMFYSDLDNNSRDDDGNVGYLIIGCARRGDTASVQIIQAANTSGIWRLVRADAN